MLYKITATFCLCVLISAIKSQSIDTLLEAYNTRVPQEKVHIHFDNAVYAPGETIWYKAYLFSGTEPSGLSKNFYIDWFDTKGKIISRTIAPIISSCASGSFTIPQNFLGNQLQVFAYTKWMLNFDSSFLFRKIIPVAQSGLFQQMQTDIVSTTTLNFFPEAGDMIDNIRGNIAFKAVNSAGIPVQVSGLINDKSGKPVAPFATQHDGMGKIAFMPVAGEQYIAEWKDALGNVQHTALPQVKPSGIVFTILNTSLTRTFFLERSAVSDPRFKKLSIVAHINQQVVFRAVANLTEKTKITSVIPTGNFPSGVLQVTVFDSYNQPLVERILFVNNDEYRLEAEVHADTLDLRKRGKNVYEIAVPDSIAASLSLSVTDGDGAVDSTITIMSQLLLSSEIKGHVHNPAFYFSDHDSAAAYLDLVMLTNGWRRFKWEDVWSNTIPRLPYQGDTSYLSIEGKIDKLTDNKIKKAEFVNLILVAKDSSKQFVFTPLNPDGSFGEHNLILFDTTKIFYQLNHVSLPVRSHVNIKNTFLPYDSTRAIHYLRTFLSDTTGLARINAITEEKKRLEALMQQTTLKEVIVKAKIKTRVEELNERYAKGLFDSQDAYQFNVIDDPSATASLSAFAYLQAKVAGLQISDAYSAAPRATWRGSNASFYLDEVPVDASMLASISMTQIAFIKVFRPPFFGAFGGGSGGAIAVYTKKGDDTKTQFSGLEYTLLAGYTPVKQYYSPNYAEQQINFTQTDLRRTLYWQPNIQTGGDVKKVKIFFYNNDYSQSLRVVLEGMADDGRLIHFSKLLK